MSLLPSSPDTSTEHTEPRVVGVDDEDADALLSALSSGTARALLSACHNEPAPPSKLADKADTSLQNAQYHLEKLEDAGAVEVVDTAYSAKGREMDVYAPADQPLVIFAGEEEKQSTLRSALSRLLGSVGVLALASLAVQQWFGERGLFGDERAVGGAGSGGDGAGGAGTPTPDAAVAPESTPTPESGGNDVLLQQVNETTTELSAETVRATETPTPTPSPETTTAATDTVREAGAGLPPGLVFFLGGLFVLAVVVGLVYLRE